MKAKPKYADIADLSEDERIRVIGSEVVAKRSPVAFIVDDETGKADRYIQKLAERFPQVCVQERFPGPVHGTITVKVGLRGVITGEENKP